jgi:hypothetical protein
VFGRSIVPGVGSPNLNALVTSTEAAYLAGVTVRVINNWRNKGWLGPDGERKKLRVAGSRDGQVLHVYRDVVAANRETSLSGKSHRRLDPPDLDALQLVAA